MEIFFSCERMLACGDSIVPLTTFIMRKRTLSQKTSFRNKKYFPSPIAKLLHNFFTCHWFLSLSSFFFKTCGDSISTLFCNSLLLNHTIILACFTTLLRKNKGTGLVIPPPLQFIDYLLSQKPSLFLRKLPTPEISKHPFPLYYDLHQTHTFNLFLTEKTLRDYLTSNISIYRQPYNKCDSQIF